MKPKHPEEEKVRPPQIHAREINLPLDPIVDESRTPSAHPAIKAAAEKGGYKSGRIHVVPHANRLGTGTETVPWARGTR